MTDDDQRRWNPDKVRVRVARDLRRIEHLAVELHWQVAASIHDAEPGRGKMLGGDALDMLGPIAPLAKWEDAYEVAEIEHENTAGRWDYAYDQDSENHPLNVLERWTRIVREERDQPTGLRATITREIDYLRKNLTWMTRLDAHDEPAWPEVDDLATDLRTIVRRMEQVLTMGDRVDRTATACMRVTEGRTCGGTLVRMTLRRRECEHVTLAAQIADWCGATPGESLRALLWYRPAMATAHRACDQGGRDDVYRCLDCGGTYTSAEYWLAVKQGLEKGAGA